ncbi:MAG: hypothetical protein HPY85_17110 [Anaerolineae bacterium]|nr:hypothetical protein [Anaerolineae bacterium]
MKRTIFRMLSAAALVMAVLLLFPRGSLQAEAVNVVIETGFTRLFTHSASGEISNDDVNNPVINADGTYAIFNSAATNLVAQDTNDKDQCYLVNLTGETIEVVSKNSSGDAGNDDSYCSDLDDTGRYVVISSRATNLPGSVVPTPAVPNTETVNATGPYANLYWIDRQTDAVTLVTDGYDGSPANQDTYGGQLFGSDRYIGFVSDASNLVAGDANNQSDVFVYDTVTETTELVAVTHDGSPANARIGSAGFSADGRYVGFSTNATDIIPGDNNGKGDVFVIDRNTGTVVLASKTNDGTQGNGNSQFMAISPDGNYVMFHTDANNLVAGDTNDEKDIFIYDRVGGTITLVSKSNSDGSIGNSTSQWGGAFSADSRYAMFGSVASNLVAEDLSGGLSDVFVYDLVNDNLRLISKTFDGSPPGGDSWGSSSMSADGQFITFESYAQNLVDGVSWLFGGRGFIIDLALQPLDAPVPETPADNSEDSDAPSVFTWRTAPHADRYTFEVKKVSDNAVVHSQEIDAADVCDAYTCTLPATLTLGVDRYKWHVIGTSAISGGTWSAYNTFTVTPPATRLRSPGVDAAVYGGRPTFKWYYDADATSYKIEFYDPSDTLIGEWQKNPVCDAVTYCEFRIPNTMDLGSAYGDYDWRVRTVSNGIEGPWSETRMFTYTPLERTWQISPADGFTTSDTTPTFEWGEITGATMYLFQLRLPDDSLVRNILVSDATYCTDGDSCVWTIDDGILEPGVTYKWHVRAKNGRNFGRWTAYRTITITE